MNEEKATTTKIITKATPVVFTLANPETIETKTKRHRIQSRNPYYNVQHYERLIARDDSGIFRHPRTNEIFLSVTHQKKKYPRKKKKHLSAFPCVPYHNLTNRKQGVKLKDVAHKDIFIVAPDGTTTITNIVSKQIVPNSLSIGKPTAQYKTVWLNQKGKHRRVEPAITIHKQMSRVPTENKRTYYHLVRQ